MDQDIITDFNRATSIHVGCKDRIKNLVANSSFTKVTFLNNEKIVVLTLLTVRKGKATQSMTYTISREHLTETQYAELVTASQPKLKA